MVRRIRIDFAPSPAQSMEVMIEAAAISGIVLGEQGRSWIAGPNTKAIEVIREQIAYGWSQEERHLPHPHLPLAKIPAALAYDYDHQSDMDAQIAQQAQRVPAMRVPPPVNRRWCNACSRWANCRAHSVGNIWHYVVCIALTPCPVVRHVPGAAQESLILVAGFNVGYFGARNLGELPKAVRQIPNLF